MLLANAGAIVTDAFPVTQRGMALGIQNIAAVAGSTIGLILGGVLSPVSWRLIFLVSVPIGLFGTVWAYLKLRELGERRPARIDWWGNLTFAAGLVAVMVGITMGIQPYGGHAMGWTNPQVIGEIAGGLVLLAAFGVIEKRVKEPLFELSLFRIRAFTAGNIASFLMFLSRGGLQFILVIWLQGIWLPEHGYSFSSTPLWAGIHMLPLVGGLLLAGPISGFLSDRFGARPFATLGAALAARLVRAARAAAGGLPLRGVRRAARAQRRRDRALHLPQPRGGDEQPPAVAARRRLGDDLDCRVRLAGALDRRVLLADHHRALVAAAGDALRAASSRTGSPMPSRRTSRGCRRSPRSSRRSSATTRSRICSATRRSRTCRPAQASILIGRGFFPHLITKPFSDALTAAFTFAIVTCVLAAAASALRGGRYEWSAAADQVAGSRRADAATPASAP